MLLGICPSKIVNTIALKWSDITLTPISTASSPAKYFLLAIFSISLIILENRSVSYVEFFCWSAIHSLSRPIPVSTYCLSSLWREPSFFLLNWIKTKFHISTTWGWSLFTSSDPLIFFFSEDDLRSTWISEQGPQGPISPISQKLSFLLPFIILSTEKYFFHSFNDSSS